MDFQGAPYPIQKDPRGFFHVQNGTEQIKSDLLCLLLTYPGERCLSGDTNIPLADGTEASIKDMVGQPPFWVYSYDHESGYIVAGLATACKTKLNAELLEVVLDNGKVTKCTPDHLWMLRDGSYSRADELKSGTSLMPLYRSFNTQEQQRRREQRPLKNHKVVAINKVEQREDCYDLKVEKYHNFAIGAGVFVHNCMLPDFGTPLRDLIFEPNDATLAERARNMIIDSISQWEPRVVIQEIEVLTNVPSDMLDSNDDLTNRENILGIRILFFDPDNIRELQDLKLNIPLTTG